MATDDALKQPSRTHSWSRTLSLVNPFRAVWWLFTSVRFAILLLLALSAVALMGVLVPQMPANVRGDALLEDQWLGSQEGTFGPLTDGLEGVGMFDVFHQRWFALLLGVTVASTGAYVVSRFPGAWKTITRPRRRVPDRYFHLAPHNVHSATAVDVDRLVEALRARRYKVEAMHEPEASYLFADRLQWAQLGTFLTHSAVIVFILAAVVSRMDSFSSGLFLAEGTILPVFAVSNPDQIQVELLDSRAEFAADGQPLDYRADMVVYRRGEEVQRCSSTVNSPCSYDGYNFHQVAYFGYGAELAVRDRETGNLVYRETLPLSERTNFPMVRITSGGKTILDQTVLLTDAAKVGDAEYRAGFARTANGKTLTFWQPVDGGKLLVFEPSAEGIKASVKPGGVAESAGSTLTYVGTSVVPSLIVPDVPVPGSANRDEQAAVLLLLQNVVYGTDTTSEGGGMGTPPSGGEPTLTIVGLQTQPVTLAPGDSVDIGGLEYSFLGQREFSGIDVRRDRSDTFVWIGAIAIVVGLMITFWVPRRRLWAKISRDRLWLAGQAPWHAGFTKELELIAAEVGATVEEKHGDDE